jgi:F0F1-type ATP synthase beta subunit
MLQRYKELQDIIAILGLEELSNKNSSPISIQRSSIPFYSGINVKAAALLSIHCRSYSSAHL